VGLRLSGGISTKCKSWYELLRNGSGKEEIGEVLRAIKIEAGMTYVRILYDF